MAGKCFYFFTYSDLKTQNRDYWNYRKRFLSFLYALHFPDFPIYPDLTCVPPSVDDGSTLGIILLFDASWNLQYCAFSGNCWK